MATKRTVTDNELRDAMAQAALISLGTWVPPIAGQNTPGLNNPIALKARAEWAYRQADAMMEARDG